MQSARATITRGELTPCQAFAFTGLPVAAITIEECLHQLLHRTFLVDTSFGPISLLVSPYVLLPLIMAPLGALVINCSRSGKYVFAGGLLILIAVVSSFRGSRYWPGFLDMELWSGLHFYGPLLLSVVASFGFAVLKPANHKIGGAEAVSLAAILVATGWSWIDALTDIGVYSVFPYSRHIAMSAILSVALVGTVTAKRFE